jgi:DNA helicase-2/ATP-dependent DNA helicase PcrA
VGDDDQSIYGWRGAEVGNILRFEKDFKNAKIIKLEQNYRSSMPILIAADSVIKNNRQRHSKTLWANDPDGEKIKIISCRNDREEARYVISKIQQLLRNNNLTANEIAILVRTGAQTRSFEEALIASALPYKIIGGLKFYDRMEIRDVLAYIRVSINNEDDLALQRIINVPKRGIGDSTISAIKTYAYSNNICMLKAIKDMVNLGILKNKIGSALHELVEKFESWNKKSTEYTPSNFVNGILEES